MSIIDLNKLDFSFPQTSMLEQLQGISKPDKGLSFASPIDFLNYLSNYSHEEMSTFHLAFDKMLKSNPVVKEFKRTRSKLKNLTHFPKYRSRFHKQYHEAAKAVASNSASKNQTKLVQGLDNEIGTSKTILSAGQVLFHGCERCVLCDSSINPTYVSATLHPIVARNSAYRRAGENQTHGKPTVCVIRLQHEQKALWGQTGKSCEYELLLPRKLRIQKITEISGKDFDIAEVAID
jgi:hypothetical protein